jgi:hypothetical protein
VLDCTKVVQNLKQHPEFCANYVRAFKKMNLQINQNISEKWNTVGPFILNNATKLNFIVLRTYENVPENFQNFFLKLLQNSQTTF